MVEEKSFYEENQYSCDSSVVLIVSTLNVQSFLIIYLLKQQQKTCISTQASRAGQQGLIKNTDSCPEKECSMTIIQFIITQNYRPENEKSV